MRKLTRQAAARGERGNDQELNVMRRQLQLKAEQLKQWEWKLRVHQKKQEEKKGKGADGWHDKKKDEKDPPKPVNKNADRDDAF